MSDSGAWDVLVRQWRASAEDPASVLLDGFHALKHALRFGGDVRHVVTDDKAAALALAAELAEDVHDALDASAVQVPTRVMRSLVPKPHPTGVAALAVRPDAGATTARLRRTPRRSPVVLLENPRNLGNIGAVVRLAAGFGATGVVTTGSLDPWHPNAVRGSAGLHFAGAVQRLTLEELPPGPVYALDPEGTDIRSLVLPDDAVLAFGSERQGISPQLRERATALVAVPMQPRVSSFNLATSVAMGLFHWMSHSPSTGPVGQTGLSGRPEQVGQPERAGRPVPDDLSGLGGLTDLPA
ncbi:TrmH family RNA methyltransferase [Streptomyces sp. MST-110588]|uniref:TrmH family RNA methyltransferase n=1 Tax=Streptomyces sp. MST-110588 TaxID=2833628 RepID=UPI001F5CA814|nr:TrmH family RNA methyltransferase [Streptomyces sp. MST-110588]UNO41008.1 TrmH family RNA methyltransferase [Streptomyces sp. MST-110588]